MAKIEEESAVNVIGILRPAQQNLFKVVCYSGNTKLPEITKQCIGFNYDLVQRTGTIQLEIPLHGGIEQNLCELTKTPHLAQICLDYMDGDTVGHTVKFENITFEQGRINHHYGDSSIVHCNLVFNYDNITMSSSLSGEEKIGGKYNYLSQQ